MDGQQVSKHSFSESLRQAIETEESLLSSLTKILLGVRSSDIAAIFEQCREDIPNQIERLNSILRTIEAASPSSFRRKDPEPEALEPIDGSPVLDAVLASAIQAAHRYSVLRYRDLELMANALAFPEAVRLIHVTMDEKTNAVERLSPFTELKAHDFEREQRKDDGGRTLILSNDNRPVLQTDTIPIVRFNRRSETGNSCG